MTPTWKKVLLLLSVLGVMFLPLPGSIWKFGGFPPGFLVFPPQEVPGTPGFNALYFGFACLVALGILAFLLMPSLFGFKPPTKPPPTPTPEKLPWWFYLGAVITVVGVGLMWFAPPSIAMWTFVPTWWGFIAALDGVAWKRNGGVSLMTASRKEFLALVVMSVLGWYFFEYLNYYALSNWYYPFADLQQPKWVSVAWYTLAYTTVWPAIGEWYTILGTIPWLKQRWENGPQLQMTTKGQWAVLIGGSIAMFIYGAVPYLLFWVLWIGPLVVLSPVLTLLGFWTPYRPIVKGDWSAVMLSAIAALCTAVPWESWNFGSEYFRGGVPANPNYWIYSIPYMNVFHIFSEMPALGYFGYLPFGVLCWVWWLLCVHLFDLEPELKLGVKNAPPPSTWTETP